MESGHLPRTHASKLKPRYQRPPGDQGQVTNIQIRLNTMGVGVTCNVPHLAIAMIMSATSNGRPRNLFTYERIGLTECCEEFNICRHIA